MRIIAPNANRGRRRQQGPWELILWSIVVAVALGGCNTPSKLNETAEKSPHQVFRLGNVTAERGKVILSELGLGEVSFATEPNSLLVHGSPEDLQRAGVVLALVDVNEPCVIQRLAPAAEVRTLPSNDLIAESIGDIAIGTFSKPPGPAGGVRAIIDIHADSVWAIVPAQLWPDIRAVVESGGKAIRRGKESEPRVEPGDPNAPAPPRQEPNIAAVEQDKPAPSPVAESRTTEIRADEPSTQQSPATADEQAAISNELLTVGGTIVPHRTAHTIDHEPVGKVITGTLKPLDPCRTSAAGLERPRVPLDNGDDVLELTLPERINLIQFIDLVGGYLHLDCVYDADKVSDQVVTVKLHSRLQSEIRVKDLYTLLETILKFKGLVMTRQEGNLVTIVPAAEALDVDPDLIDPNTASIQAGEMVVTRVFRLQHIDVASVSNLLQNMKLGLAISPVDQNQTLFVTCYAHRMGRIAQLVDMVDRPGRPKEFRFRQLRYTVAKALAEKVIALAAELEDIPITIAAEEKEAPGAPTPVARGAPRRARPAGESGPAPDPLEQSVYLDMDERTNRVLMIGYGEQLATVEELIDALDIPEQDVRTLSVCEIRHVEAASVLAKLTDLGLINKPVVRTKETAAKAGQPAPPVEEETPDEELQVVLLEATNALLVNATREQHDHIEEIIRYIDNSPQDLRKLKVYPVEHMEAEDALDKLEQLDVIQAASGSSPRLTEPSTPGPARAASPTGKGELPAAGPQAVVLETTNSLFVRATDAQHATIAAMIRQMDVEAREERIPYEIYFLENQDPEQLSEVLGKLIQETVLNKEGKIEQVIQKTQEQITIVPDKTTFSLIVYASRKNQEWIADLVEKLDKRRPQVLIDVTLVEITETEAFNYDLNLIASAPDLTQTSGLTGVLVPGDNPITSADIMDRLVAGGRSQFADFQSDSGELNAFYGDKHINLLLEAMQSKNYGRVLAKPKILVNDNEPGTIKTADTTYVAKRSSIPVSSGAAGTDVTLVETAVNYEPYEAGITLDITPHISQGDLLRMEIELTRSDFRETEDPERPPNQTSSELKTTVFVPDASTIILGGLLRLNQNKGGTKVPILGDIPIVGGLFRTISNKDLQSKLYIFVKAEIIRPAGVLTREMQQLESISERNRRAFEEHEQEFQGYQSWPGVKSQPIDPAKVLETR